MSESKDQNVLDVKKSNLLDTLPIYVGTVLFGATVFLVTVNVLARTIGIDFISEYAFWAVPLSRYTLIVMTYLGVAIAFRNGENVKINYLRRETKKRGSVMYHIITILVIVSIAAFGYLTIRGAIQSAMDTWSSATDLPFLNLGMVHLGIAIAFLLMMVYLSYDILDYLQRLQSHLMDRDLDTTRGTLLNEDLEVADEFSEESGDVQSDIGLEKSQEIKENP